VEPSLPAEKGLLVEVIGIGMPTVTQRRTPRAPIEPVGGRSWAERRGRDGHPAAALLIATKLEVPRIPQGIVHRPRLHEQLTRGVQGLLTILVAQAGAGKTVLMSSWAEAGEAPGPVAWLSVDAGDSDSDAVRFWAHVLAALRGTGVVPADGILSALAPPLRGSDETFLGRFVNGLAELPERVVLVLDDLHELTDPTVIAGLEFVVRHAPAQLRLVIGTRAEPDLSLYRLRVAGELTELRTPDLAFTQKEAGELLAEQGMTLTEAELALLWARTEGWAAGLRLAGLSLTDHPEPGRFVEEFTGDHRTVADYLVGEVLSRLPAPDRDFLLQTCVVDRLTGDLADVLTDSHGGDLTLVELERANTFLVPVGRSRSWYRYHQLFADLLRAELRSRHPAHVIAELHRRATGWYAANGYEVDAIRHAIAAEDWGHASRLVIDHWFDLFVGGAGELLGDLLAAFPPERVRADPELAVAYAGGLLGLDDPEGADVYLRIAEAAAETAATALPEERRRRLAVAATVVKLLIARAREESDGVIVAAGALPSPAQVLDDRWERFGNDEDNCALVLANLGVAKLWAGDLDDAADYLDQGLIAATVAGRDFLVLDCLSMLAVLAGIRGQAHQAATTARKALEVADRGGWSRTAKAAWANLVLAWAHYSRDELQDAHRYIVAASEGARGGGTSTLAAMVALGRALILAADGDPAAGLRALRSSERDLTEWRPNPVVERGLRWGEARLLASLGDTAAARALVGEPNATSNAAPNAAAAHPAGAALAVVQARLALADNDPERVMEILAPSLDGSARIVHLPLLIEAWLLDAMARSVLGDQYGATCSLERALELAEPERHHRAFIDGGALVRALLIAELERGSAHSTFIGELLDAVVWPSANGNGAVRGAALAEPLTDRELAVLRYLPTIMSTTEIASEMFVSVNTVKTHLQHIYRKLDSTSRRDAVRRARQIDLL
jgi:LuxR family maltose regulon positive regulatory protein